MRAILGFFALASGLFGAITASPASLSVSMRAPIVYPWVATMFPQQPAALYDYTFTLSGTGPWTAALTGALNTDCLGPCLSISSTSGTGAGTITISYLTHGGENLTVGSHTGTLTIGSTPVSLTVVVLAANPFMSFAYAPTYPSGCTNPNTTGYSYLTQCSVPNERPSSTSFSIPSVCGSYTDPVFGGAVKRLTLPGPHNTYSSVVAFSATNKYVYTSTTSGSNAIYKLSDCSIPYAAVTGLSGDVTYWDPFDDEKIWYFASGVLKYVILNTSTVTTAADYTSAAGGRPAMNDINVSNGSTSINDAGLLAFNSDVGSEICVVDTVGLTTSNQETKTKCSTYAAGGMSTNNYSAVSAGVDSVSGKIYVHGCGFPVSAIYSVGATALNFEFNIPQGIWNYYSCSHSGLGELPDGEQVIFWQPNGTGNQNYVVQALLNKGTSMTIPVEVSGGGLSYLYTGNNQGASEFACVKPQLCIQSTYEYPPISLDPAISSITNGASCTLHFASAHGFGSSGTVSLQVGGSNITGINGAWTATITTTTAVTIPTTCAGSYTANTGTAALNTSSTSDFPLRDELVVTWLGNAVYRIAQTRTKPYGDNGSLFYYYSIPFASLSRDGQYVAFNSNMGVPEQTSVYVVATGLGGGAVGGTGSFRGGNGSLGGNLAH